MTEKLIERIGKAICRETCAFKGEPPCFEVHGDQGEALPWPPEACDEPGCIALAEVSIGDTLDALKQWKWAEDNNDRQELENARRSRDAVLACSAEPANSGLHSLTSKI